jgi:hypothetical protein
MRITIEPVDGRELDRFITARLNATGAVHCAIHDCAEATSAHDVLLAKDLAISEIFRAAC